MLCAGGFICAIIYDILSIIFKPVAKNFFMLSLRAIVICTCWAFVLSFLIIYYNRASLRYFMPLSVFLGALLWKFTLSRLFSRVFLQIWEIFLKIFKLIFKILLTPLTFLHKIIIVPFYRLKRFMVTRKTTLNNLVVKAIDGRENKEKHKKEAAAEKHLRSRCVVCCSGSADAD